MTDRTLNPFLRIIAGIVGPAFIVVSVINLWNGPSGFQAWVRTIFGFVFGGFLVHVAVTGRNYDYEKGIS
jgi:hypothetical protein